MSKKNKLISIITFTSIIISETFILIIIAIITVIIFWIILSLSLLLMLLLLSLLLLLQGRRKLFCCKEIWVKLSGTIVGRGQNVLKLQWLKCPKTIPTIFGPENKWLNTSNLEFIYWFHIVWFSRRKFSNQQKLSKKIIHFTIQFCSKNLNLRTSTHSTLQKIYSHKTAKNMFLVVVRKKHLHCTISRRPGTVFSANLCSKPFVPVHRKLLFGGRRNNFHQADHCLGFL